MQRQPLVLAPATASTGPVAGVYYGFSVAVNPGLARQLASAYNAAMQAINEAIVNQVFAASFLGRRRCCRWPRPCKPVGRVPNGFGCWRWPPASFGWAAWASRRLATCL